MICWTLIRNQLPEVKTDVTNITAVGKSIEKTHNFANSTNRYDNIRNGSVPYQHWFVDTTNSIGPLSDETNIWKKPATLYFALFPGLLWAMRNDSPKDSFSNATII